MSAVDTWHHINAEGLLAFRLEVSLQPRKKKIYIYSDTSLVSKIMTVSFIQVVVLIQKSSWGFYCKKRNFKAFSSLLHQMHVSTKGHEARFHAWHEAYCQFVMLFHISLCCPTGEDARGTRYFWAHSRHGPEKRSAPP